MIENHQMNCSMPLAASATHTFDTTFGLGLHLEVLRGQTMCNAIMQAKRRMRSFPPEYGCGSTIHNITLTLTLTCPMILANYNYRTIANWSNKKKSTEIYIRAEYRAAATEYFFQKVSE
jgi:hypothetical protein